MQHSKLRCARKNYFNFLKKQPPWRLVQPFGGCYTPVIKQKLLIMCPPMCICGGMRIRCICTYELYTPFAKKVMNGSEPTEFVGSEHFFITHCSMYLRQKPLSVLWQRPL